MGLEQYHANKVCSAPNALQLMADYRLASMQSTDEKLKSQKEREFRSYFSHKIDKVMATVDREKNIFNTLRNLRQYELLLSHMQEPALDKLLNTAYQRVEEKLEQKNLYNTQVLKSKDSYKLVSLAENKPSKFNSTVKSFLIAGLLITNVHTCSKIKPEQYSSNSQKIEFQDTQSKTLEETVSLP